VHQVVDGGYYVQPTIFKGHNKMRVFQDEIFGPVASVTTFKSTEEAIAIANDTMVRILHCDYLYHLMYINANDDCVCT